MSKESKILNLEKISGRDIKRYILSFNYCIENLDALGFYDTWFDNFFEILITYFDFISSFNDEKIDEIKQYCKDKVRKKIKMMESDFISEQEQWSDEFSDDDLDELYRKKFDEYFSNFFSLFSKKYNELAKYFKTYKHFLHTKIYSAIKQLFTRCRLMYNTKRRKHITRDWVENDPSELKSRTIVNKGYEQYNDVVHKGITFRTNPHPLNVNGFQNIYGKIIRGSLYPLNNNDLEIAKKYFLKFNPNYKYKGKILSDY